MTPVTGLAPWSVWVIAGLILLVAELLAPGVFLMWLGIAGMGTGLVTRAAGLGVAAEVAVFAVFGAAAIAVGWRFRGGRQRRVNAPGSGLVGRHAAVTSWADGHGRVRVGDSEWPARAPRGEAWPPGMSLRVIAVEGTALVVDRD